MDLQKLAKSVVTLNVSKLTSVMNELQPKKIPFFEKIILSDINKELVFGIMRDFRIGGLNPNNYEKFINKVNALIKHFYKRSSRKNSIDDFLAYMDPSGAIKERIFLIRHNLSDFNLKDVSDIEAGQIWKRAENKVYEKTHFCWHPEASLLACSKDENGNIKISSAHSIQRGKILKSISEGNKKVKQLRVNKFEKNKEIPIRKASTFFGFCDIHDKIFYPIELVNYSGSLEQNFLFAYRAFVHSAHIKLTFYEYYDFGTQPKIDIAKTKDIFDSCLAKEDYSKVITDTLILNHEYPIAVTSESDLEYDFEQNYIEHSNSRMETFFINVFPQNGKTNILFSYLKEDADIYDDVINQIRRRGKLKSDLSVLIAGHCENVFFSPSYYETYIENQEENINKLVKQTQFDFVPYDGYGNIMKPISQTPSNYLDNEFNIQLFFE